MLDFLKHKTRVLVLDDDPAMQRLIADRCCAARGIASTSSARARRRSRRSAATSTTSLLLDLMTPTEGGVTVMRHLKKTKPQMLRRVILVTASPESVLRSVAGDAAAVVHKPFEAEELLATVKRVLTQQ